MNNDSVCPKFIASDSWTDGTFEKVLFERSEDFLSGWRALVNADLMWIALICAQEENSKDFSRTKKRRRKEPYIYARWAPVYISNSCERMQIQRAKQTLHTCLIPAKINTVNNLSDEIALCEGA